MSDFLAKSIASQQKLFPAMHITHDFPLSCKKAAYTVSQTAHTAFYFSPALFIVLVLSSVKAAAHNNTKSNSAAQHPIKTVHAHGNTPENKTNTKQFHL